MTNEPKPNTRAGEALKACPFCGSPAYMHSGDGRDYDRFAVKCDGDSGRVRCPIYPTTGALLPKAEAITAWNTRPLPQPSELVERPSEAIEVLGGPYRQLDMDGVIVGVSRQAIYETLTYLTQLEAQITKLQADGDKLAGALKRSRTGWANVLEVEGGAKEPRANVRFIVGETLQALAAKGDSRG